MEEKKAGKIIAKILNILSLIFLIVISYYALKFYNKNNLNDFVRSIEKAGITQFERDNEVKYLENTDSYKIISRDYNDAMFSKNIKVQKYTPYKVTCKVKTEGVISELEKTGIGAQISIANSTERSVAIQGTKEWQEIQLIFNSKDREEVQLGFRLGGNDGNAKGKAWFTDFKIETGIQDNSTEWKFACFIFDSIDVNVEGKKVNLSITSNDLKDINQTIKRFEETCSKITNNKMTAKCDIYEINNPITSLSYDDEFGYYVGPEDVENHIKDTINAGDYDHIFIIMRLGNEQHDNDIEVNDWIGLGYMDYYGIGFSNIRLPNSATSYIYKYNTKINTFPEEVFLHEFLHSLERTLNECNYEIPALHDNEKYGYKSEHLEGLKKWYSDYMNSNIESSNGKIGLNEIVYRLKPAKVSNFEYSYELNEFREPENVIEYVRQMFRNIGNNLKMVKS